MTITTPTLDESIERMKQEIIDDIKAGRMPADSCPNNGKAWRIIFGNVNVTDLRKFFLKRGDKIAV